VPAAIVFAVTGPAVFRWVWGGPTEFIWVLSSVWFCLRLDLFSYGAVIRSYTLTESQTHNLCLCQFWSLGVFISF